MYHYRNNNKTNFYENTQFLSTSFNFYVANSFISETTTYNKSGTELYCCFLNIKIPVGTHVLLLMPYSMYLHEYEVLLKDKHLFKIIKTTSPQENAVTVMEIIKEKPKGKKVEQIDFNPDIENYFKEAGFTLFGSTLNDLRYLEV